ncbi:MULTISPECIES: TonB-dependent receptor [unclassified Spirosoma]|uniref:SusC/RagA family TonB-linked outer membrane protein n=1 Tax=unclassified Spirosoma TaxID=2621999 RepID=UPI00095CA326|nr:MULTISPECIES: TonB-dependent receptor [unclassified Spirosoma]MBN8824925.1 TonB-dependent receptor [Spirosoma sp.]OJW74755.1 MAG: SusC/RagA family TonB-linked outer membrane protein [Spirosoma sp. 48-14]
MKKLIRLLLLFGVVLGGVRPGFSQVLAKAQQLQQRDTYPKGASLRLKDVLKKLQDHYEVDILFFDRNVEGMVVTENTINFNANIEQNLNAVLKPLGLRYKKVRNGGYVVMAKEPAGKAEASSSQNATSLQELQTKSDQETDSRESSLTLPSRLPSEVKLADIPVQGTVVDDKGEGLPGVSIVIKGSQKGTTTDALGKYRLDVPNASAVLIFSYVGYLAQEVTVGNQTTLDVTLKADNKTLDEIVVVGYGTVKKKDLTGSVGVISNKEIKDLGVTRIEQGLAGRVAGVQVKVVSGEPGAAPQIRVRGIGSISAGASPLYVVDGFPTDNIQTLNPNDIETLDILKDASATAIYGSRGSNGVVIITTKRGKAGKANITLDTYYGWQSVSKVPIMKNSKEQAQFFYDGMRNKNLDAGKDVSGPPTSWTTPVPAIIMDVLEGRNTTDENSLNKVLVTAPQRQIQLSATGGSENIRYAVSGEYFNQDGIIINSGFKRYSMRSNIDAQLSKRLALKISLNPAYTELRSLPSTGVSGGTASTLGIVASTLQIHNFRPLLNPDGSYFNYAGLADMADIYNPLAVAQETITSQKNLRLLGNVNLEYQILNDLKFNVLLGGSLLTNKGMYFRPQRAYFANELPTGTDNAGLITNWLTEYTLNYTKTVNKHSIAALAGFTAQKERGETSSMTSNKFPNNLVPTLSAVGGLITNGTANIYEWSLVSYLARVNYNYNSKYYLTSSIRTDGSSRFGTQNKYGIFPSLAVAWRISDEAFLKNRPEITELKLRASYGVTGNNNIGNYDQYATVSYENYGLGNSVATAIAPGRIANPNLTWETQSSLNFGVDASFFNSRITASIDHFTSHNTNLLLNVNIPNNTGFSTALQNIGEVKNTGWEFVLGTVNIDRKIKWSTDFNLSTYRNKVEKLGPQGDPIYSGNNVTMIGQPIGMFFGWLTDGIFKTQAELDRGPVYNPGGSDRSHVGDIRFVDINGDGVITNADKTIMGSPYPDFFYGMTNRVTYKNLSLSVSLQGSKGNMIYNTSRGGGNSGRARVRGYAFSNNYWKSEQDPGDGKTPRPNDTPTGGVRLPSQLFLDTGTYLRINNITLAYVVPSAISQKLKLNSLRVYVNANNPFIFTKNTAFNPDVSTTENPLTPGVEANDYPLPKSLMIGLNVGF